MKELLKGKKTYIALGAIVMTVAASVLPNQTILTPDVTAAIVALLAALAAYLRSLA
jgi:hypothetical protein